MSIHLLKLLCWSKPQAIVFHLLEVFGLQGPDIRLSSSDTYFSFYHPDREALHSNKRKKVDVA